MKLCDHCRNKMDSNRWLCDECHAKWKANSDRHNHNTADQPRGQSTNDRIIHVDGEPTEEAGEPTYGQRLADGFAWRGRDE